MKYYEKENSFDDNKVDDPLDFLRFIIILVVFAPFRICLEVSKKVLYTGEYLKVFIKNCFIISSSLVVFNLIISVLVTRRLSLYGSFLPLTVQVIALIFFIVFYLLRDSLEIKVDFSRDQEVINAYRMDNSRPIPSKDNVSDKVNRETTVGDDVDYSMTHEDVDNLVEEQFQQVKDINLKDILNKNPELEATRKLMEDYMSKQASELKDDIKDNVNLVSPEETKLVLHELDSSVEKECLDVIKSSDVTPESIAKQFEMLKRSRAKVITEVNSSKVPNYSGALRGASQPIDYYDLGEEEEEEEDLLSASDPSTLDKIVGNSTYRDEVDSNTVTTARDISQVNSNSIGGLFDASDYEDDIEVDDPNGMLDYL